MMIEKTISRLKSPGQNNNKKVNTSTITTVLLMLNYSKLHELKKKKINQKFLYAFLTVCDEIGTRVQQRLSKSLTSPHS